MTAPVAIFAYRRPWHAERLVRSLLANPEARDSRVYAFCDGPRTEQDAPLVAATRRGLAGAGIPRLELVERPRNLGLAASVIDGVTRLTAEEGRVIVLEDDLILSRTFLRYMNDALDRYASEPGVFHVSGYAFPLARRPTEHDAHFLPFINSSGWATWARAWQAFDPAAAASARVLSDPSLRRRFDLGGRYGFSRMLRQHLAGRTDSWAIRWYLSVFLRDGLALFPELSLVENDGFQADSTHCASGRPTYYSSPAHDLEVRRFPPPELDRETLAQVSRVLGADDTLFARASRRLRASLGRLTARATA